jgi:hypothetical protein
MTMETPRLKRDSLFWCALDRTVPGRGALAWSAVSGVAAPVDREQLPVALDALQRPRPRIVQRNVGANDQVAYGPGDKDLAS